MDFPMTERYDLLISSMRSASLTVTYTFAIAMTMLAFRASVRWLLPENFLPVLFRDVVYNAVDLLLIAVVFAPIILSP